MTHLPESGDGALVLVLAGEFDSGTMAPFRRALADAPSAQAARPMIDVSGVGYASSGLLRLLVHANRRLPRFTVTGPLPLTCAGSWNSAERWRSSASRPDIEAARRA
ncbi:STAS domain-containing protein [Streptomyces exfoliatus]|uniref:STAS domain-containing protein n=1 Tax=Streptomyces exfoliatus TaxID=1905 RepID=UPI0012FF0E48